MKERLNFKDNVEIAKRSYIGRRFTNQDRVHSQGMTIRGKNAIVLAVADGMGGQAAGELASQTAIDTVKNYVDNLLPKLKSTDAASLNEAINRIYQDANKKIWEISKENEEYKGLGTTLVLALAIGQKYIIANVGDSRCYYINRIESWQITEDHTEVGEEVRRGVMTEEAAKRSPFRSAIYRSLGEDGEIEVDFFPKGEKFGLIEEPCALFLCSDGLSNKITSEDIHSQVLGTSDIEKASSNLISLAYSKGSDDNITVALVEFERLKRAKKKEKVLPPVNVLAKKDLKSRARGPRKVKWLKRVAISLSAILVVLTVSLFYWIKTDKFPFEKLFQMEKTKKELQAQEEKMKNSTLGVQHEMKESIPEEVQVEKEIIYNPHFMILPNVKVIFEEEFYLAKLIWVAYTGQGISYQIECIEMIEVGEGLRFLSEFIYSTELKLSDVIKKPYSEVPQNRYEVYLNIYKDGERFFRNKLDEFEIKNPNSSTSGDLR